jgi:hypothetical protein
MKPSVKAAKRIWAEVVDLVAHDYKQDIALAANIIDEEMIKRVKDKRDEWQAKADAEEEGQRASYQKMVFAAGEILALLEGSGK